MADPSTHMKVQRPGDGLLSGCGKKPVPLSAQG
jgi:hypothetical protein